MTTSFAERIRSELDDRPVSAELRARIEAWVRADKEFNVWFLVTTKRALADDELMALLDGYRESQEVVEEAWKGFQGSAEPTKLLEGITRSIARMEALQDP